MKLYSTKIRCLCQKLLTHIAHTLGISSNVFNEMFGEAVQAVRINYYPPCARPESVLGLSSHSDGSAITVLQQDTACVGLQVLKHDMWVPVNPLPHAFVINIGDTLEVWQLYSRLLMHEIATTNNLHEQVLTNGRYKSVEHRAVTNGERERMSVVTFYAPSYDVELGPLAEVVGPEQPAKYKRYKHGEYNRHYVTNRLQGKKTLDFAKIS